MNLPQGHYGLIAQEVENVLPSVIAEAEFNTATPWNEGLAAPVPGTLPTAALKDKGEIINFKTLNYTELLPIVVKAIQEQQEVIEKLAENNSKQQQRIEKLEQLIDKLSKDPNVYALSSNALIVASPNPAKSSASIRYNIPEGGTKAQLVLTDMLGRTVKTVRLNASGNLKMDVSMLNSGAYNCSLFIDNKLVQTRKMTVAR